MSADPPGPETGPSVLARDGPATPPDSPARLRDYLTLTKPGITGLILLMAVAGFFAADPSYPPSWLSLVELLVAGGLASAGAAALNHWYDRDVDLRMNRTRRRPVPAERVGPRGALVVGIFLSALGWSLALVWLPLEAFLAIASGTLVYVGVYTIWLKRRTRWNIVVGGYAGSAPVLAGAAVAAGHIALAPVLLALLVFLWTPPHFWSLALVLRDDYARADLPMLPVANDPVRSGRSVFASGLLLLLPTLAFAVVLGDYGLFLALALVLGVAFAGLLAGLLRDVSRKVALRAFIFSGFYLMGIGVAMVVNWLYYRWPGV